MADSIPSDALYSGRCGTCTWYVSAAGQLVVYPTNGSAGDITATVDYKTDYLLEPPWAGLSLDTDISRSVTRAMFRKGVSTRYISYLFSNCVNLREVDLTNLTIIGEAVAAHRAFAGCASLQAVDLAPLSGAMITSAAYMFRGCTELAEVDVSPLNLTSVTDAGNMFWKCASLSAVSFGAVVPEDVSFMFADCTSLTSLDLSDFNTSGCEAVQSMLMNTPLLTTVHIGDSFSFDSIYAYDDYGDPSDDAYWYHSNMQMVADESTSNPKPARNITNGIQVSTNKDFAMLTTAQREGTWLRQVSDYFSVSAIRTNNGTADEDGTDITLTVRFATSAETTDRTLSVYIKQASASTYPSAPSAVVELEGDSGIESVTLQSVGDDAYDLRCEFYDGTTTFLAFPSVASNIRLFTLDESGNAQVFGGMTVGTPSTEATYAGDYAFIAGRGSDVAGSLQWNGELAIPGSATIGGNESVAGRLTMQSLPVIVRGTDGYLYYDDGN